jgi:histidinol-phosphate aminotransferase
VPPVYLPSAMSPDAPALDVPALLGLLRPEVRALRAYRVATEVDEAAKLDQNESPYDLPEELKRAACEAFIASPWNRYPADRPHALVARLAETLDWPAEGIIVGRGSNELTHTVGSALVAPGTPVVLPHPMFSLYEAVVRLHGGAVVPVDPEPDFSHTAGAVIAAMRRSEAPLTVVTTPNNPTGAAFSYDALREMAEAAPGFLLVDEAYVEFVEGPTGLDLLREHPNVLVMRTFSKAMGLAGLRLGILLAHPEVAAELEKPRLPFLVDRLSEAVALAALDRPDLVRERVAALTAERDALLAALARQEGVEALPSAANFFLFRTARAPAALQAALLAEGVRVRNVTGYPALAGGPGPSGRFETGWLRVSVGTPAENSAFRVALERVLGGASSV